MHRNTFIALRVSIRHVQRLMDSTHKLSKYYWRDTHLSIKVILIPFLLAMYINFLTKSANPKSLTLRPQRAFMPLRFKSLESGFRHIHQSVAVQVSSGNPRIGVSILRCFRAKTSLARSRLFEPLPLREWLRLVRLIALRSMFEKFRRVYIVSVHERVRYLFRP